MNDVVITIISVTLVILLLIAGIVITFFVSGRQKIRQEIEMAETKLIFEKELRTVETEVSEFILGQMSSELHDNIGQLLTALHIQLENQKIDFPQMAESFKPAEIYMGEINQQLRMLSRTMNRDYIGHLGLYGAIQLEAERLRGLKRFEVHVDMDAGPSNLQKDQDLMTFRIFQEVVQNSLRHARAKNFFIKLRSDENEFRMEIRDDGQGFDLEQIMHSSKASGLRNITKRARLAGLELEIQSKPSEGSLFVIWKNMTFG